MIEVLKIKRLVFSKSEIIEKLLDVLIKRVASNNNSMTKLEKIKKIELNLLNVGLILLSE
jgi:hypothetical protein